MHVGLRYNFYALVVWLCVVFCLVVVAERLPRHNNFYRTVQLAVLCCLGRFWVDVLGYKIIIIRIPLWNRKDVYHYEGRVYLSHGTNVFIAKPEDSKKLHDGIPLT